MLPTPVELRGQARLYRDAARFAKNQDDRRLLAACALALAQIAEALEGEGRIDTDLERAKLEKLLASSGERVRKIVEQILSQQRDTAVTAEQIKAWRMRAEELRTTAEQFAVPSAQESLRRAAENYEKLADNAEHSLARRPASTDKTG